MVRFITDFRFRFSFALAIGIFVIASCNHHRHSSGINDTTHVDSCIREFSDSSLRKVPLLSDDFLENESKLRYSSWPQLSDESVNKLALLYFPKGLFKSEYEIEEFASHQEVSIVGSFLISDSFFTVIVSVTDKTKPVIPRPPMAIHLTDPENQSKLFYLLTIKDSKIISFHWVGFIGEISKNEGLTLSKRVSDNVFLIYSTPPYSELSTITILPSGVIHQE